jgi:dimeric dUTPase (all-alpha-NTP-PPase superfamily)
VVELAGEVPREFHWKYWSKADPFVNRERVRDELVDVLHFVGNILVSIGVTDDELEEAYREKQEINRQRQLDRYVAASGKESDD